MSVDDGLSFHLLTDASHQMSYPNIAIIILGFTDLLGVYGYCTLICILYSD
jgi:hypothetical protein